MKKKVHILIEGFSNAEEIADAIKRAVCSSDKEPVDNPEDADIILVTTYSSALRMIKENDEATILIYLFSPKEESVGARALKERYPDRIVICQHFEMDRQPGDEAMMPYLMQL